MAIPKPRLQWRGRDRQILNKLRNALLSLQKRDARMNTLADEKGFPGFYFAESKTSSVYKAMIVLMQQVIDLKKIKA